MFRTADDSYSIEFFSIPSFWDLQNKCSLLPLLSFSFFLFLFTDFYRKLGWNGITQLWSVIVYEMRWAKDPKLKRRTEKNENNWLVKTLKYFGCQDYNSFLYLQWFRCRFLACVLVKSSCITKFINIQTQATATRLSVIITAQNMKRRRHQQQEKKEKRMEKVEEDWPRLKRTVIAVLENFLAYHFLKVHVCCF